MPACRNPPNHGRVWKTKTALTFEVPEPQSGKTGENEMFPTLPTSSSVCQAPGRLPIQKSTYYEVENDGSEVSLL